jgi:hypothetical protein
MCCHAMDSEFGLSFAIFSNFRRFQLPTRQRLK